MHKGLDHRPHSLLPLLSCPSDDHVLHSIPASLSFTCCIRINSPSFQGYLVLWLPTFLHRRKGLSASTRCLNCLPSTPLSSGVILAMSVQELSWVFSTVVGLLVVFVVFFLWQKGSVGKSVCVYIYKAACSSLADLMYS